MNLRRKLGLTLVTVMLSTSGIAPMAMANTETVSPPTQNYSNYSVEQLESLIAKLQKLLAEMKKGTKCFVSEQHLSIGDGEPGDGLDGDVRRLQLFLKEKGSFKVSPTGYFGKITRAALQNYQKTAGITITGEFDAMTRAKAHDAYCKTNLKPIAKTEKKAEQKTEDPKPVLQEVVRKITLVATNGGVQWKVDGYSSKGFKVVWSKNQGPTYPTRDGDTYVYLSDPKATDQKLEAFSGAGTYSVRVCEYLGGSCGLYSNEVLVQL